MGDFRVDNPVGTAANANGAAAAITVTDNERINFLPTVVFVSDALALAPRGRRMMQGPILGKQWVFA